MSGTPWPPHAKAVTVLERSEGGLVVRPRPISHWAGTMLATSAGAAFVLSAAIVWVQVAGWPPLSGMSILLAVCSACSLPLGYVYRDHPERWRFLAWWVALVATKAVFVWEAPYLLFPFEALLLLPAWGKVRQAARVVGGNFREADLAKADFKYLQFVDADFTGVDLRGARFANVRFEGCRFADVDASGARFENCVFAGCEFSKAKLQRSIWERCAATRGDFSRADLSQVRSVRSNFYSADFRGANFCGARFNVGLPRQEMNCMNGAQFEGARFNGKTVWPADAMPVRFGAINVDEELYQFRPAGGLSWNPEAVRQ